ncbi:hypothetical protein ACIBHX_01835 [Nonomuraea sp. NPDC050536]|uniref:hypothetical protein n=1 Tax=Nonomuraea sp. NPDC050536 TaxID=3364366 RepID=UPI0037CC026D
MSNSDGVLAAIDACLEDCSVSEEAMRWAPDEPDPTFDGFLGAEPTMTFVDEATSGRLVVPNLQEGVTAYFAVTPPEGEQPHWRPIGSDVVSDLTFAQDETFEMPLSWLPTYTIVLPAESTRFARSWLNNVIVVGKTLDDLLAEKARRRCFKSEYHRRQRRRTRR